MNFLMRLFVNRKTILALIFIGALFGGGWYVNGVIKERDALQTQVTALQYTNQQNANKLKAQEERHKEVMKSYDAAMRHYVNAVADSSETNNKLKYQLENLNNEKLDACMGTGVDAEFLDRVFNYPTNDHTGNHD